MLAVTSLHRTASDALATCAQAVPAMFGGGIGTAFAIKALQSLFGMR